MKAVLAVIDVQNGFVNHHSEDAVGPIADLIKTWQLHGLPVIATRFHNSDGSMYERLLNFTRLKEAPETDLHNDIADLPDTIIDKFYYTLFTDETKQLFKEEGWDTIILCGIDTDCCVAISAADAFELGLTPYVVIDACASSGGPTAHDAGVKVLERIIGRKQVIMASQVEEIVSA